MTAPFALSRNQPRRNDDTAAAGKSSGKFSEKFSGRDDVLAYRQHFALVWQQFIVENFDSPAHAAHVFQVDATTAAKWWAGENAPSGWCVGRAIADPGLSRAAVGLLTSRP